MTARVLLFAKARDLAGRSEVVVSLPDGATVAELRQALGVVSPALLPLLPRLHVAINNNYASDSDPVPPDVEIACFPPVSGG